MSHPLNTPLGHFGIKTSEEGPRRCVASIPAAAMINPLTDMPTIATLAMLVDHVGGLVNHHRRRPRRVDGDQRVVVGTRSGCAGTDQFGAGAPGDAYRPALRAKGPHVAELV